VTAEREPVSGVADLDVVDLVSFSTTVGAETLDGEIGPGGTDGLYVGGTLVVPKGTAAGVYRSDITVTVDFQ
jgi:hypothetical protein